MSRLGPFVSAPLALLMVEWLGPVPYTPGSPWRASGEVP